MFLKEKKYTVEDSFLPAFSVSRESRLKTPSREFNVLASLYMGGLPKHKEKKKFKKKK